MAKPLTLEIIVIGAGLGGLAAAIALCDTGHRVTVLEAVSELVTAGAGIQIPPPSTRILRSWGLFEPVETIASKPRTFTFRDSRDGRRLGAIPLNPFSEQEHGSPWWTVNRAGYQQILFKAAIMRGALIKLDHRVPDLDPKAPAVIVSTKNGTIRLSADIIIGADRLRSRIRGKISNLEDFEPRPSTICAYRALVPLQSMQADPLRESLMDAENRKSMFGWLIFRNFQPGRLGTVELYFSETQPERSDPICQLMHHVLWKTPLL